MGSTEQHGPHLPLDTDTRIAVAVSEAVATGLADGPPLHRGRAGVRRAGPVPRRQRLSEHEGFPGTISIGTEALAGVLLEFGRSAMNWASRLVFVNGHGGNVGALGSAVGRLRHEGRDAAWCPCLVRGRRRARRAYRNICIAASFAG